MGLYSEEKKLRHSWAIFRGLYMWGGGRVHFWDFAVVGVEY